MPAQIIINADDFGLTRGINRAIEELHQAGVLTSATLMANGAAFDDAVAIAHRNPSLGIGCHVVLVDGRPLLPPERILSLVGDDGNFRASLGSFARAALLDQIRPEQVVIEAGRQIARLQSAGIVVTHIDTHKHTHVFPAISRPLLGLAEKLGIRAIRNPFEPRWTFSLGQGGLLRRLQMSVLERFRSAFLRLPQISSGAVATSDGSIGISATGALDKVSLTRMLRAMPAGTWELVCHPGYSDRDLDAVITRLRTHRDIERQALLTVLPPILEQPAAPRLIHYGSIGSRPPGISHAAFHQACGEDTQGERVP